MINRIKIGNKDYKVIPDDALADDHNLLGEINFRKSEIKVYSKQCEQELQNTLVHEAVHGMLHFMGEDERNRNEESVERIANGLLMLVKDNPKLFNLKADIGDFGEFGSEAIGRGGEDR